MQAAAVELCSLHQKLFRPALLTDKPTAHLTSFHREAIAEPPTSAEGVNSNGNFVTNPALAYPRRTQMVDASGYPTNEFARFLEELAYKQKKLQEAAEEYVALNTGTATTAQIAAALNTLVATILET